MVCDQNQQSKPGHEIQSCTLELINGLVSLVLQTNMIDVAQEAMEALLVLHQPEKIEMWNPEAPINTFWDVRQKIIFLYLCNSFFMCVYFILQLSSIIFYISSLFVQLFFHVSLYFILQLSSIIFYISENDSTSNSKLSGYTQMAQTDTHLS